MAERYPEAELVLDDELLYDDAPRRSMLRRSEERAEDIVREGEVLAGKYRVERIPGRNGLGVLVQVRHMELGQEVTLKFLVPEACAYPEFVQRFVREARAAVRIQGEHVARVTDVGRLESGAPYMVREYLRGPDLAEVLKVRGPLPIAEAVDYIIQACEGVAEGHALGVVHRNLRPTSLIVARRSDGTPLVKVFDFAASESLHVNPFTERAVSLVGTSAIMASLPYLAPEQIRDPHDVDYRADVYSLGAVLYELLTGTPVYAADAAPALLAQVAADPAASVRSLRSDVPGELDHIVLRCLAKNRAIRYSGVAELVLALGQFASADGAACIDHIVRLAKRTSKLPQLSDTRTPSSLPPAPASNPSVTQPLPAVAPVASASTPAPARGRHGTQLLHTVEPVNTTSLRPSVHEDVTTINPYAAYGAPVVITQPPPEAPRSEGPRTEPLRSPAPARSEPVKPEPLRTAGRYTPQPPPLRSSVPPPLRDPSQHALPPVPTPPPPAVAAPEQRATQRSVAPSVRREPSELPPSPRSSMSGLSRSWAVPEEPQAPVFTKRRLIGTGVVAACATLAAVLALRAPHAGGPVAAAAPVAAPAKAPPPAPVAAPAPVPVEAAPVASASAAAVAPVAAAPVPAPVAAAPVSPAPVAPAPIAAAPVAAPRPVAVAPAPRPVAVAPAPVVRRPAPAPVAPAEVPHKPAAPEKVASTKPAAASGDLFDDTR